MDVATDIQDESNCKQAEDEISENATLTKEVTIEQQAPSEQFSEVDAPAQEKPLVSTEKTPLNVTNENELPIKVESNESLPENLLSADEDNIETSKLVDPFEGCKAAVGVVDVVDREIVSSRKRVPTPKFSEFVASKEVKRNDQPTNINAKLPTDETLKKIPIAGERVQKAAANVVVEVKLNILPPRRRAPPAQFSEFYTPALKVASISKIQTTNKNNQNVKKTKVARKSVEKVSVNGNKDLSPRRRTASAFSLTSSTITVKKTANGNQQKRIEIIKNSREIILLSDEKSKKKPKPDGRERKIVTDKVSGNILPPRQRVPTAKFSQYLASSKSTAPKKPNVSSPKKIENVKKSPKGILSAVEKIKEKKKSTERIQKAVVNVHSKVNRNVLSPRQRVPTAKFSEFLASKNVNAPKTSHINEPRKIEMVKKSPKTKMSTGKKTNEVPKVIKRERKPAENIVSKVKRNILPPRRRAPPLKFSEFLALA